MVTTRPPKTIVEPTALGPVANTDAKLLIYRLFQKGRVLAQDDRNVLKLHEPSVRHHASQMQLDEVREGDDWWTISERLDVSVLQLRMHNPFLATRALRVGQLVAFPPTPRTDLFVSNGEGLEYRTRHGDNYLLLSFVLDVDRDALRDQNGLWLCLLFIHPRAPNLIGLRSAGHAPQKVYPALIARFRSTMVGCF